MTHHELNSADPTADRKARVTISVNLPQYDGSKGHAAKFVAKCISQLLKNFQNRNGTPCSWILLRKKPYNILKAQDVNLLHTIHTLKT